MAVGRNLGRSVRVAIEQMGWKRALAIMHKLIIRMSQLGSKRTASLSITHKLNPDHDSKFDVCQPR